MAVSIFDASIVGGSPSIDGATPGVALIYSGTPLGGTQAAVISGSDGISSDQQIPVTYIVAGATAYIGLLNFAPNGTVNFRTGDNFGGSRRCFRSAAYR